MDITVGELPLQPRQPPHRLPRTPGQPDFGHFVKTNALSPLDERGWLAGQPPAFREWVADHGRWQHYHARQVLYDAGDEPDGLYGLGEGALEVTLPLVGDEPVTIHRAEPGFWIGDSALFAGAPRLVSLAAATDARVFRVPAAALRALVADRPAAWRSFYELSHTNTTIVATLLAEALTLAPRAQVARLMLRLADGDGRVEVRQDDLSRLIGMTRSSLQRALADLAEAGAISRGYGCLLVRDRARLDAISRES
jgi:CRP-like cAMP-binding protein